MGLALVRRPGLGFACGLSTRTGLAGGSFATCTARHLGLTPGVRYRT